MTMTSTETMLRTHPEQGAIDRSRLMEALSALQECALACSLCADACLAESDVQSLRRCIRLDLNCADVCEATARVISRQAAMEPSLLRPLLEACIEICRVSGDECERHASHMEHCRVCAERTRACEQACRALLEAVGTAGRAAA